MDCQQHLIAAFQQHVAGNHTEARTMYQEVLAEQKDDLFARVLTNLLSMQESFPRMTKKSGLQNLKARGFQPKTVIDVGAQVGTPPLYEVFPEAHQVMLEPVAENEPSLKQICSGLPSAEYLMAAVAQRNGTVSLSVSDTKQYASVVLDNQGGSGLRQVPAVSLNELCQQKGYAGPYLVKIDVDGFEIEVLRGASTLIEPGNVFVIEASLADETPRFAKIIDFLRPYGFVLHDIVDNLYRPGDMALWQVDVVMVHESSPLTANKHYC